MVQFAAPDKRRPALVLTRDNALEFLNRATVAPITSTIRGIPTEVALGPDDGMRQPCAVNLDNVVTVPLTMIGRRLAALGDNRMAQVCGALAFAVGCEPARKR